LPSDPDWAGEVVYTTSRSAWTPAAPKEMWKLINDTSVIPGWRVERSEPAELLRLSSHSRRPGREWLEMRVRPASGPGSHFEQRTIFYPQGIAGRIYWYGGLPLHRRRFDQTFRQVTARAAAAQG